MEVFENLEKAVLGSIILEPYAIREVIDDLKPKCFKKRENKLIYEVLCDMHNKSLPIDLLTISTELHNRGLLATVGGAYYVSKLTNDIVSSVHIKIHARGLIQEYLKAEAVTICHSVIQEVTQPHCDVLDVFETVKKKFDLTLSEVSNNKEFKTISSIGDEYVERLTKIVETGKSPCLPTFSYQLSKYGFYHNSDLTYIGARPGMGKCLGKGTKVLMFDGSLKKVEDVLKGDLLMGDDSQPRKVLSIARGQEKMYWIHQNKAMSYRVNESHILSLKRSRNENNKKKGDVLNIEVKEYLTKSTKFKSNYKGYKTDIEFKEQNVTLEPYYLGLWLGDGDSRNQRISNSDKEIINYLKEYSVRLGAELIEHKSENRVSNFVITNKKNPPKKFRVQSELRALGVLKNKHIPNHYLINSKKNRLQLLAGLLDTDGHYDYDSNCFEIVQVRENLAKQIKFICDSLGFRTSLKTKKASIKSTGFECDAYRVRIFGNLNEIPTKVERKKARVWASKIDWKVTGIKVEYDKIDDYYGFEIDGNRLFLLEDFTVTHNTAFLISEVRHQSFINNIPVGVFSLEMSAEQLLNRIVSAECQINGMKISNGDLDKDDVYNINQKLIQLAKHNLFIDDTARLDIDILCSRAKRMYYDYGIKHLFIDYIGLVSTREYRNDKTNSTGYISNRLKALAKELNIPVTVLSQLSREIEKRPIEQRMPTLSDLRNSGDIEQDADLIMFLFRPEYYGVTQINIDGNELIDVAGKGFVGVAKNRHGKCGTELIDYVAPFTEFR